MKQYVAFLHPIEGRGYRIEFPDFRQSRCEARRLETARILAEASLEAMLEDLAALGREIPEPSLLADAASRQRNPHAIAILIDAYVPGRRSSIELLHFLSATGNAPAVAA